MEATRHRQTEYPDRDDGGIYLAERFLHVTTEPENFRRRFDTEFEDASRGEALSLYLLDPDAPDAPERVFGYLDCGLAQLSHWYVPYAEIAGFLGKETAPG